MFYFQSLHVTDARLSEATRSFCNFASMERVARRRGWWHEVERLLARIHKDHRHIDDLFPYFMDWCRSLYPHLTSVPQLERSCDLSHPAEWLVGGGEGRGGV